MQLTGPHFFFDFDSTLVTKESLDMVIERALASSPNRAELVRKVEQITQLGMEGTLKFTDSLRERFSVVPLSRSHFEAVGRELCAHITPGMAELFVELAEKRIATYIISGGFRESILPVAEALGVPAERVFCNSTQFDDAGWVSAIDVDNVCYSDEGKAPVIQHIKETEALTGELIMVGDGANDLKAFELGVATDFCGFVGNVEREVIRNHAPQLAHTVDELRDFILKKSKLD